jgi:hypothetical protein
MANKYLNKKKEVDGIKFDSKKEATRYGYLKIDPEVSDLQLQVSFPITINGILICRYIADFVYFRGGFQVVEDVKGVRTAIFILKKKLMKAVHNIDIKES